MHTVGEAGNPESGNARRRGGTRAEIQHVALALFTERGYDATSMREIAEHLGITKAALYYHFSGKEAIIASLLEENLRALDDLLAEAARRPPSPRRSTDLLADWVTETVGRALPVVRFAAANPTALPVDRSALTQRLQQAVELLLGPDAPLADQLRARMALLAGQVTVLAAQNTGAQEADILTAALKAAELLTAGLFPKPAVHNGTRITDADG
ncbi:TetR/AcrR family transcriptional regulator [Hamadaea tsunoensis]|uniref:TetR/AcrR family transcriptional regulator n=1 Tax=Hamadaea tsunoensis TaxID=53368 RepID=UPI000421DCAA|nr:TetR/AcrR family transcriptional regulator [Hamadaea tsunoensis]